VSEDGDKGTINSISEAIREVRALRHSRFLKKDEWCLRHFPLGLFFRGQSEIIDPEPRVFRDKNRAGETGCFDETNVFEHLKLRVPTHGRICHSAFDWLCLMQHYSIPTRLLDWSESVLAALYFAVKDHIDRPGELIVLNARRLNTLEDRPPTISTPDNGHVIIQAEMAATRSSEKLRRNANVVAALEYLGKNTGPGHQWLEKYATPIAVFPSRLNERMVFQASVFTLHGGKRYPKATGEKYQMVMMPEPVSLVKMNHGRSEEDLILKRYTISTEGKKEILEELEMLGIHEGTLFPEVDRQAVYLEKQWWYPENNGNVAPQP
jgi:hypothetical protein